MSVRRLRTEVGSGRDIHGGRVAGVSIVLAVLALLSPRVTALAATPTQAPTASASPTATPPVASSATATTIDLALRWDDHSSFTWVDDPSAAGYSLVGGVSAVRGNAANPFCARPLVDDTLNLTLNEEIARGVTSFTIALPALPAPDRWFVPSAVVELKALDGFGGVHAAARIGFLSETMCGEPAVELPNAGAPRGRSSPWSSKFSLLATTGCILLLAGHAVRRGDLRH